MQRPSLAITALFAFAWLGAAAFGQEQPETIEVRISVAEQKLVVLRDGMWVQKFSVSTSKFGLGDSFGSYKTPLGRLRVCEKIGAGLPAGAVLTHRNATGEVLPVNARGRDPIVTRIIWLDGLEDCNERSRARGIYIHGTVEEGKIGKPVSYGCIRMRSREVMELFDMLPVGALVTIQQEKLPRVKRWSPPAPLPLIAAKEPVKPELAKTRAPVLVAQKKVETASVKVGTEPVKQPSAAARLVIKASGTEDHGVQPGSDFGANAMKGSILFADLPGQTPPRKN
ncbi:MAG: L,D-transpeptidase [Chthoniobacteraceae bacterium]